MLNSAQRNVIVANRVARILGVLAIALFVVLVSLFGLSITSPIILSLSGFFFFLIYINNRGHANIARILLSVVPAMVTLLSAILAKKGAQNFTDILYYDARFFMVLLAMVPCLIFSISEPFKLYGCLAFMLALLMLFDPVHEFFQLGYFQRGFTGRSYYYINYVTLITFIGMAAGSISLKRVIEKTEKQNQAFKSDLMQKNQQLSDLLKDIETQNEEIISQSDELFASQEKLIDANRIIESQKLELQKQVIQVNSDLEEANEELIKHNNELRQFSYTISHNLRGPIARLLGLAQVANLDKDVSHNSETMTIINHIRSSALELDNVIRDLNKIVEIKNPVHQLKQELDFANEWRVVKDLLHISDAMEKKNFHIDFTDAPYIFSVRPMINSILFNLVSNAIKYQSPERELKVTLRTFKKDNHTVIEISDNGLGIDINAFHDDLFKLYKRFHVHQEGKGLGLYLIKSQAESLNGSVDVKSAPDAGSVFTVSIKDAVVEDASEKVGDLRAQG